MSDLKERQENIEKQLAEIEMISSIYSNTNEFLIEDPIAILEAEAFLTSKQVPARSLGYIIKFGVSLIDSNEIQTDDISDNEANYAQVKAN